MNAPDEQPVAYRLEHLHQQLAADPSIGETDVVLELFGEVLVVSAYVPSDERRKVLIEVISATWTGPIRDEIEVLSHLADNDRSQP